MKIDLTEIYKGLKEWRHKRGITAAEQKADYLINVMKKLGELAPALKAYKNLSATDWPYPTDIQEAEHDIINAICNIAIFTINSGADIPCSEKANIIDITKTTVLNSSFSSLLNYCGDYAGYIKAFSCFNDILLVCAKLCEVYGFNFEIAMLETIKEISSHTGEYDEASKKWIKDESDVAKSKWYKANYELAKV